MAGKAYDLKDWSEEQDAELVGLWHSELGIRAICKQLTVSVTMSSAGPFTCGFPGRSRGAGTAGLSRSPL